MKYLYSICSSMFVSIAALLLSSTLTTTAQQVSVSLAGTGVTNSGGYYEFVPTSYASSKDSFPLLIFIHGMGELGNGTTDLPTVLRNGVPKLLQNGTFPSSFTVNGKSFSFIVASPQFKNVPSPLDVLSLVNYLRKKFPRIDSKRIYITGLSMGGGATEDFVSSSDSYAQIPAAAVAIAGNMNPQAKTAAPKTVAKNSLPIWFLHNEYDVTVPSQYSKDWISLINAGNPPATAAPRLTIFNTIGHDAWSKAYDPSYREDGMNIYEWMLQYEKGGKTSAPANKRVIAKTNIGNGMYYTDAMKSFGLKPGDTLCIAAGDYEFIQLGNLVGTAEKPIVITNCGGQVRVGIKTLKSDIAFNIMGGKYLHISGSGTPGVEYGFDVNGKNLVGVKMLGMYLGVGSSDIDVHNIYFHDVGIFIVAKTTQECGNSQFWEGNYVMKNVKIHHIKGRYSDYEGFYIGNTHYTMDYLLCQGIKSHHIQDLEVYDNDLQYMGQDGIQISMADLGTNKVHHNIVRNYGTTRLDAQSYGMLMGGGSRVRLYNNVVDQGYMPGIALFGSGISYVYNNTVSNVENGEGINVSDKLILEPVTAYIFNNTIFNTGNTGVKIYAYLTTIGHKVYNNIVVEKSPGGSYPANGFYIRGSQTIKFDFGNNLYANTADAGKLVKNVTGSDFHLVSGSTAIDKGFNALGWGISTDMDDLSRPLNGAFDIGAYEYNSTATPPKNVVPVANAGSNIRITLPTSTVTLNGSASADSDGSITAYLWRKVSGPGAGTITAVSSANTTVTGLTTAGTYVFALTVTDDLKATHSDSVTVTVLAAPVVNKVPIANAGTNIVINAPNSTATLNGSASTDTDGSIVKYAWRKISGAAAGISTPAAVTTSVTGLVAGTYDFELTITDNSGASDRDTVNVKVNPVVSTPPPITNKPPVAGAGNDIIIQLPTNTVTLNGSASTDTDGSIVSYYWEKISGPDVRFSNAYAAVNVVSGMVAGNYIFRLTVKDNKGASAIDYVNVTVKGLNIVNIAPIAKAGNDATITLPVNSVILNGSGSSDTDGRITSYLWQKVTGKDVKFSNASGVLNVVSGLTAGTYVFELKVTDDRSVAATDRLTVTVLPSVSQGVAPVAKTQGDLTLSLPVSSANVDASQSYVTNATISKYEWKQLSGPLNATVATPNAKGTRLSDMSFPGKYVFQLTVTASNGKSSNAVFTVTVTDNSGEEYEADVTLFPNPAVNVLYFKQNIKNVSEATITIFNMSGKAMKTYVLPALDIQQKALDITSLSAGMYILQAQYKNGAKLSFKFVKGN